MVESVGRTEITMPIPMGYRAIAADLEARIQRGEYEPGSPLPTYKEFADMYSVSVTTMQSAIRLLTERGLIVGVQGKGLYVAERPS